MNKRKGISLIVLVITILVMIILAGVVVVSLQKNNPIEKAKEANFKENLSSFNQILHLQVAQDVLLDKNNEKVSYLYKAEDIKKVIPEFKEEYAEYVNISNGKLVYCGPKGNEEKWANDVGIYRDTEAFVFTWEATQDNQTLTLPLQEFKFDDEKWEYTTEKYSYDFIVDYGDGTGKKEVKDAKSVNSSHTYSKAGRYVVTINGYMEAFKTGENNLDVFGSRDNIKTIESFGNIGYSELDLGYVTLDSIATPNEDSFKNIKSADFMFYRATIKDGLPKDLFRYCPQVTSFISTFCMADFGEIPEDLFKYNVNATDFSSTFAWANITKIPGNLFKNNTKAEIFSQTFRGCTNVTSISPDIFKGNTNVKSFNTTFRDCKKFNGNVPELWKNSYPNLTNTAGCFLNVPAANTSSIPSNWK